MFNTEICDLCLEDRYSQNDWAIQVIQPVQKYDPHNLHKRLVLNSIGQLFIFNRQRNDFKLKIMVSLLIMCDKPVLNKAIFSTFFIVFIAILIINISD